MRPVFLAVPGVQHYNLIGDEMRMQANHAWSVDTQSDPATT